MMNEKVQTHNTEDLTSTLGNINSTLSNINEKASRISNIGKYISTRLAGSRTYPANSPANLDNLTIMEDNGGNTMSVNTSTGFFTVNQSGMYNLSAAIWTNNPTVDGGLARISVINRDLGTIVAGGFYPTDGSSSATVSFNTTISLSAGQQLAFQLLSQRVPRPLTSTTLWGISGGATGVVSVTKVG